MPKVKAELVRHEKITDELGNTIEIKVWQVTVSKDKPHGYKYSLVYIVEDEQIIGYDNAEEKGDHRHYRNKTEPYGFVNLIGLVEDFYRDIKKYKEGKL